MAHTGDRQGDDSVKNSDPCLEPAAFSSGACSIASARHSDRGTLNDIGTTKSYPPPAPSGDAILFGSFRLLPAARLLTRDGRPVQLGSRAHDILVILIERCGQVVSKEELFAKVWPNMVIDESALRVHIAGLRKALGDGQPGIRLIANVHGRGYVFVADVERLSAGRAQYQP
jgi:DNA-binding winged helix-turn-helix (wHTH) protein